MYKSIAHTILALFLLVVSTGITISMHYCNGNLVTTTINDHAESCCDDKDGCCNNKELHFELQNDYVSPSIAQNSTVVVLDLLFPALFVAIPNLSAPERKTAVAFSDFIPPPKIQTRLSLLQTYLC